MMIHRIEKTSKETRVFSFDSDTGVVKPQVLSVSETNAVEHLKRKGIISENDRVLFPSPINGAFSAPIKIYIDITDSCQLNCKHCLTKILNKGNEIPFDTIKLISEECYDLGVFYIKLGGGEPLLHKDFPRILELFRNSGQFLSLSTNGYLVDDRIADLLLQHKVKTTVSIEGPERIDAEMRGNGHYEVALKALKLLQNHHVNACLRVTLTKNILDIKIVKELIEIAKKNETRIKFSYCRPAGSSIDNELLIGYEDREKYRDVILYLNEKMSDGIALLDEGMMINQPSDLHLLMYDERICGCTNKSMHINSSCRLSPCVFLGTEFVCKVPYSKGILKKYWQGIIDERVLAIRNIGIPKSCNGCKRLCKYECLATRLYFNKDTNLPDPNCLRYIV